MCMYNAHITLTLGGRGKYNLIVIRKHTEGKAKEREKEREIAPLFHAIFR